MFIILCGGKDFKDKSLNPGLVEVTKFGKGLKPYVFFIEDSKFGYFFHQYFPEDNPIDYLSFFDVKLDSGVIDYSLMTADDCEVKESFFNTHHFESKAKLQFKGIEKILNLSQEEMQKILSSRKLTFPFNKVLHRFNIEKGSVGKFNMKKGIWSNVGTPRIKVIRFS